MKKAFIALAMTMVAAGHAAAIDLSEDGSFKLTGFYSLTAARVTGGSSWGSGNAWTYMNWKCPCTIQTWEYAAVYEREKGWELNQESLLGVQLKKEFSPTLAATVQLVSRAHNPTYGVRPTVDWAYLTWQPAADSNWTFQAGRFRIPLYYYSDYLYIGYAYPWVRPMPDVYGWPIYAYNGANVTYRTQLGQSDWAATVHAWSGSYTQHNDAYDTIIYWGAPTSESWKSIVGGYVAANNGVFDVRVMGMTYKDSTWQAGSDGSRVFLLGVQDQKTRIAGLSANMDYKNWLVKSELDRYMQRDDIKGINNIYKYALFSFGYQFGSLTPMYSQSRYRTVASPIEGRDTRYVSLRWDFHKNMSLKGQFDISNDKTEYAYPFFGNSKLMSVSLQGVF